MRPRELGACELGSLTVSVVGCLGVYESEYDFSNRNI